MNLENKNKKVRPLCLVSLIQLASTANTAIMPTFLSLSLSSFSQCVGTGFVYISKQACGVWSRFNDRKKVWSSLFLLFMLDHWIVISCVDAGSTVLKSWASPSNGRADDQERRQTMLLPRHHWQVSQLLLDFQARWYFLFRFYCDLTDYPLRCCSGMSSPRMPGQDSNLGPMLWSNLECVRRFSTKSGQDLASRVNEV